MTYHIHTENILKDDRIAINIYSSDVFVTVDVFLEASKNVQTTAKILPIKEVAQE